MLLFQQKRNLARLTLSVLLAIFCSVTTWATGGYLSGHGTQNDPYIIADVADWN